MSKVCYKPEMRVFETRSGSIALSRRGLEDLRDCYLELIAGVGRDPYVSEVAVG